MTPREGVEVVVNLEDLQCQDGETVFLIGGAQLFETLLPQCDSMYLTWIDHPYEGDTLFPPFEHLFQAPEILGRSEGLEFRLYKRIP